ncbi:uncharacterized protein CTRU02_207016 [Colletotrichum truncatum]|uniref:Uncharacterized protein n=1 Tax=Colletotrichum truncatum TaxID=5467 RepID=A0ACC3YZA0_COLTU|nr:uncharacterized protein CTRU02_11131 [Colletotrichum truncatum]KAF6786260.1 hypothetical protein CTRU02_11131 [Colletotrichum truncatum]
MEHSQHPFSRNFPGPEARGIDPNDNIRAWLDGIVIDEETKPIVTDVLHALSGLQHSASPHVSGSYPAGRGRQTQTVVNVQTIGPGFIGRAPPVTSTEFLANVIVVAILLLFAPGFTLLAAGVFFTSRVAERWVSYD